MDSQSKNRFQQLRIASLNKKRLCMYENCREQAIKSHVLQKNGILKQISEDNHLIQLNATNINELENKGMFNFKRIGVNDVYTFNGFCNYHDSLVFKEIEGEDTIDLYNPLHQALFSYRGLCQEIRRKEISSEWIESARSIMDPFMAMQFSSLNDGYKIGINNLNFFKKELEESIREKCFLKFKFHTVKIPKIDLCISVPLNVNDFENPLNLEYEEWQASLPFPFTTSFINVFPYKKDSYFIGGYHKDYPCKWTANKANKFSYLKNKKLKKELSDLVVLMLEFWTMSPKLFRKISPRNIEKYKRTFSDNVMTHSEKMKTSINLFENT